MLMNINISECRWRDFSQPFSATECPHIAGIGGLTLDECKSYTRSLGGNALNYDSTGIGVCNVKVCPASEDIMVEPYVNDDHKIYAEVGCHRLKSKCEQLCYA